MSQPGAALDRQPPEAAPAAMTGVRWTVCALIFFATTVNYLDRQIFSLLVPFFEDDLRLGPTDLALINVSFILPYGFAMIFVGRYIDKVGIQRGLSTIFLGWNLASIGHALVRTMTGFIGMRFLLGVSESGMFPAAIKTVTEWFPIKERSFATGLFNAGANCGAILAPLIGVAVAVKFGWRMCFLITGGAGIVWILFWDRLYRPLGKNPKVGSAELAFIHSDPPEEDPPVSYAQLFAMRPIYALSVAKALSDAPWWFYLTWMPKILIDQFHVSTTFMAFAIPVIYIIADGGSVAGGWLSSALIHHGKSAGAARKLAMLVCAIAILPAMVVGFLPDHPQVAGISSAFWAVGIVALAAGAHQGWSCNLFTLISDTVPKSAIAMAVGAINGFAMVGVSAMQLFVGKSVQMTSSYEASFMVAGCLYLIALALLQIMLPKVQQTAPKRSMNLSWVFAGAVALLIGLGAVQYEANRPAYTSINEYLATRGAQVHADSPAQPGPKATVGWMAAQWFKWPLANGKAKLDLMKLDTQGRPFIEPKGASAPKYHGPTAKAVSASFGQPGS